MTRSVTPRPILVEKRYPPLVLDSGVQRRRIGVHVVEIDVRLRSDEERDPAHRLGMVRRQCAHDPVKRISRRLGRHRVCMVGDPARAQYQRLGLLQRERYR
jgi:hypothetical protein